MTVELNGITKKFGTVTAVDTVDLQMRDGEFVALLGPSGCGKTTTLLMNAGIYDPTEGEILFDGRRVNHLPPRQRDIGMVFQSYALYPHMTAYQNIIFSQVLQRRPKGEMQKKAQEIADMLGIGELLERKPAELSGGQQQRVALGRALIKEPGLLLFDEPLSNLDARLRIQMRAEIKRLQHELGITSLYVTHDQIEAITMADRIAVMNNGVLEAFGTPAELHDHPPTRFIAEFIGNPPMNFVAIELRLESGTAAAIFPDGTPIPIAGNRIPVTESEVATFGIRPEHVKIVPDGIPATVNLTQPMGRDDLVYCSVGDMEIGLLTEPERNVRVGDSIGVSFEAEKAHLFDGAGRRLSGRDE